MLDAGKAAVSALMEFTVQWGRQKTHKYIKYGVTSVMTGERTVHCRLMADQGRERRCYLD